MKSCPSSNLFGIPLNPPIRRIQDCCWPLPLPYFGPYASASLNIDSGLGRWADFLFVTASALIGIPLLAFAIAAALALLRMLPGLLSGFLIATAVFVSLLWFKTPGYLGLIFAAVLLLVECALGASLTAIYRGALHHPSIAKRALTWLLCSCRWRRTSSYSKRCIAMASMMNCWRQNKPKLRFLHRLPWLTPQSPARTLSKLSTTAAATACGVLSSVLQSQFVPIQSTPPRFLRTSMDGKPRSGSGTGVSVWTSSH